LRGALTAQSVWQGRVLDKTSCSTPRKARESGSPVRRLHAERAAVANHQILPPIPDVGGTARHLARSYIYSEKMPGVKKAQLAQVLKIGSLDLLAHFAPADQRPAAAETQSSIGRENN